MSSQAVTAGRRQSKGTSKPKMNTRRKNRDWPLLLPKKVRAKAAKIADDVANRLIDTDLLVENLNALMSQAAPDMPIAWQPAALMQGFPGLAMMCFQLDKCEPGVGWARVGTQFMKIAIGQIGEQQPARSGSLCEGSTGLAFGAMLCPSRGAWRKDFIESQDAASLQHVQLIMDEIYSDRSRLQSRHFDTLYGITGIGRYFLSRLPNKQSQSALTRILETLVFLSQDYDGILGFYTPYSAFDDVLKQYEPTGMVNNGLAHGVPGPLVLMSLAVRVGFEVAGLKEATTKLADWVVGQTMTDEYGINWPRCLQIKDTDAEIPPLVPSRVAWCYGTPGIARALWLAGDALNVEGYKEIAVQSMKVALSKSPEVQRVDAPTICHGVAGLLQIALRFAADTSDPEFVDYSVSLAEQLFSYYDPKLFWGYQDKMRDAHVDNPAFLYGAAGIVLALLAGAYPVEPRWDAILLIS